MPEDRNAAARRAERRRARQERAAKPSRQPVLSPRGPGERPPNPRKIFAIGFQKTGTTTMTIALRALGCSVAQPWNLANEALRGGKLSEAEADRLVHETVFGVVEQADVAQDSPVFLLFKELDARFPGSKFVYTARDEAAWIDSAVNHFGDRPVPLHEWMYGVAYPKGHEDVWLARFRRHRTEVQEYFADRPGDLLFMDLAAGDGWYELVSFLGPEFLPPFPHGNRRR